MKNSNLIHTTNSSSLSNNKYWADAEDDDFFAESDSNIGVVPNPRKKISADEMKEKIRDICGL